MTKSKSTDIHRGAPITRPVRRSIMITLIALFFVISPLVILYTIGYRYDVKEGIVRETGVLSVDVKPEDVHVYLDHVEIKKKVPIRLPNLSPGTYNILIERAGYKPWQKDITIESKQTTYIKDITLFKEIDPTQIEQMQDISINNAAWSYDGTFLLYMTTEDESHIVNLFDINTRETHPVYETKKGRISFQWSPYANHAVIEVEQTEETHELILFSADNPGGVQTITIHTSMPIFQWSKNIGEPRIYIEENDGITAFGYEDKHLLGSASSTAWFVDEKKNIWSIFSQKKILQKAKNGVEEKFSVSKPVQSIMANFGDYIIARSNDNILVLKEEKGQIIITQDIPGAHIRYNNATKEWVVWSPWEVWSIYEDGSVALHNRTSEPIKDAWPLDEFGVILLVRDTNLIGFNPGYFVSHTLFENGSVQNATVDAKTRTIYFWGTVDDQTGIWKLPY